MKKRMETVSGPGCGVEESGRGGHGPTVLWGHKVEERRKGGETGAILTAQTKGVEGGGVLVLGMEKGL